MKTHINKLIDVKNPSRGHKVEKTPPGKENTYDVVSSTEETATNGTKYSEKATSSPKKQNIYETKQKMT